MQTVHVASMQVAKQVPAEYSIWHGIIVLFAACAYRAGVLCFLSAVSLLC
jgi:hypothetical protein